MSCNMHVTTLRKLPFIQHECYMHATCMLQNLKGEPKQLRQPDNFHIASLSPYIGGRLTYYPVLNAYVAAKFIETCEKHD